MERIGIVGLGRMGSAMAQRFAAAGCAVSGWTRSGRTVEGVTPAADLPGLVARSDVLVTSLYDDAAVAEVLDGLLGCDIPGRLVIETSTVVPGLLTDRAARFADAGASVSDAPISGGPEMVAAGTCGVFVGADDATAERVAAVMGHITPRVLHVGPLGAGMVMKTINNGLMQSYVAGLRELLPLAKRAGIPLEQVMRILNGGPAGLRMIIDRTPKILGEDPEVGFTLSGITKDNEVFRKVVESHGLKAPVLTLAGDGQRAAMRAGLADLDPAAAIAASYNDA